MKLPELVQTILNKEKNHPYVIAFEGMIGSGKSYEAHKMVEELNGKSLLIPTDLFVVVPRTEWTEKIMGDDIDLSKWYDLPKIKEALESVKRWEPHTVTELYNLSNGQFDDELEIDARDYDYIILEGLFSCNAKLDGLIDLKVFLDVPPEVALERAHVRDETVRHLDHQGWLQKKDIFYNHYMPYLEAHKKRADIILDPE